MSVHPGRWRFSWLFLLCASAPLARAAEDPLATAWRRDAGRGRSLPASSKYQLPPEVRASLGAPLQPAAVLAVAACFEEPALSGVNDTLLISKDDGFATTPLFEYEGRLSVSPGVAGPTDHLGFRFSTQDFAHELPVSIAAVSIGFDNAYGRATWPLIALAKEDPAKPLNPSPTYLAEVAGYSLPASQLPAPAVAGTPDAFMRLRVALPTPVAISQDLSVNDGTWSDNFDRTSQETLDNANSDWLECNLIACPGPQHLLVDATAGAGSVVKIPYAATDGDAVGFKYPKGSVFATRPVNDLDLDLSVRYDVATNPSANRAGLFFRAEYVDRYYVAEFNKATSSVVLLARNGAAANTLQSVNVGAKTTGTLAVKVWGVHPTTHIVVSIDGTPYITVDDATYAYAGAFMGLASLGATSGEIWDDFVVKRNPDNFVVILAPPGLNAALPAEMSSGAAPASYLATAASVPFHNVYTSTDGQTWARLAAQTNCLTPANAFVGLEVKDADAGPPDVDNLFQTESKPTSVVLSCPTCTTTRNLCGADKGPADYALPVFEVNKPIDINLGWWNEHVPDVDYLYWRVDLYQNGCPNDSLATATWLSRADRRPVTDKGQVNAPGAQYMTLATPLTTFTPLAAGDYCAMITELYDKNLDCCPDGFETTPGGVGCPPACSNVADPDQNAATGVLARPFTVELACTPAVASELNRPSLRLVKNDVDASKTNLSWQTNGATGRYNIHLTESKSELAEPTIRTVVPPYARVVGALNYTMAVPAPVLNDLQYVAVFQNDGCASGWSLVDP